MGEILPRVVVDQFIRAIAFPIMIASNERVRRRSGVTRHLAVQRGTLCDCQLSLPTMDVISQLESGPA